MPGVYNVPMPSKSPRTVISLKSRALRLLARREHSRFELECKLTPYEDAPGQLVAILDELQVKGFISEERVLSSVIHRRASKLGNARIVHELNQKGLSKDLIAQALHNLKATELLRAHEVWLRKFERPAQNAAQYSKQVRFLISRGFSSEVVRKILADAKSATVAEDAGV